MEKLYAEFLLWFHGFDSSERYETLLNEDFLNNPNKDILLELEECSSNMVDARECFVHYWSYECPFLNPDIFGKALFEGLQSVYQKNSFRIEEFGRRCYRLWQDIPFVLGQTEPFWTLSYADDCLSWGDEGQTRMLYERAFAFYD